MLASVFDADPLPFIALMGLGFVIGVTGHIYKSRTVVATGIGMIFVATLLLPLGIYLGDHAERLTARAGGGEVEVPLQGPARRARPRAPPSGRRTAPGPSSRC